MWPSDLFTRWGSGLVLQFYDKTEATRCLVAYISHISGCGGTDGLLLCGSHPLLLKEASQRLTD